MNAYELQALRHIFAMTIDECATWIAQTGDSESWRQWENGKGAAKPIPFAEDTCVPPEHLADYIAEFRALLDSHGLSYGMFGHVDAGVLHVRPALDMCDPQQEILMKQISDDVVALTAKYGGLLWGEHGKGFRAEYSPAFFGEELFAELRKVKAAFDPHNRLNPGKICPRRRHRH